MWSNASATLSLWITFPLKSPQEKSSVFWAPMAQGNQRPFACSAVFSDPLRVKDGCTDWIWSPSRSRIKSSLGYMSQRFSLYDDLRVEENMAFFGGIYGLDSSACETRIREVLALIGLTERRQLSHPGTPHRSQAAPGPGVRAVAPAPHHLPR